MNPIISAAKSDRAMEVDSVAARIAGVQKPDGEIPWSPGGRTDPWDLVEAAMGLSIGGYRVAARRAFEWMAQHQLPDGSWYAAYRNGVAQDATRDTNLSTYLAVGVYHHYLITRDIGWVKRIWETVRKGIEFALKHQAPGGEIFWAISPTGAVDPMALLTGSSSIFMSLKCALALARCLGHPGAAWRTALCRLGEAIRQKPHLFNMTKSRYAMDWYYPVLCGAVSGTDAQRRMNRYWKKFVINGHGVRCVSDRPWVTVAETCELSLALSAMGKRGLSQIVFNWTSDKRYDDGAYWCGYTIPDMAVWPEDRLTWTDAAVLIAADALYQMTPAGRLFHHRFWQDGQAAPYP